MEEEVVEVATKVAFTFKPMVTVATAVVSLASGVAIGLIVGQRRAEKKYADLAAKEIAEARLHYAQLHKKDQFATPEKAAEALLVEVETTPVVIPKEVAETIRSYGGDPRPQLTEDNIFKRDPVPEQSLVETSGKFTSPVPREPGPYVITDDEYNDGEVGYTQVTLTYYAGDDTLSDENDSPIFEVDQTIGDALSRFGENSGDENTVFVRNTRIELDFEVVRSPGKYSVEVAGLSDDSLKHSEPMRRGRRVWDD